MLPKLNETPSFRMTIPSQNKKVLFRPYLVKEEKILLVAMEMNDPEHLIRAMVDTIKSCVTDPIDETKLTAFDIEYMFLMIRAKSVGEKIPLNMTCSSCGSQNESEIDLEKIGIPKAGKPPVLKLTDTIRVQMKYPSYQDVLDYDISNTQNETEILFRLVLACIDSIMTENENIPSSEISRDQLSEFVESMSPKQYNDLAKFVVDIPALSHTIEYKCKECGEPNSHTLSGLADFFR